MGSMRRSGMRRGMAENPQDATGAPTSGTTNCTAAKRVRSSRTCSLESRRSSKRQRSTAPAPAPCRAVVPKVQEPAPALDRTLAGAVVPKVQEPAPAPCRAVVPKVQEPAPEPMVQEAPAPAEQQLSGLHTIIINLDRRPDRLDSCVTRLKNAAPMMKSERFRATDGRQDAISSSDVAYSWHTGKNVIFQRLRSQRKGWNDLDSYQVRTLTLSPGERGCASSHIRAWRLCLELAGDSERPLLVIEDDAAPTSEFSEVLQKSLTELPKDAHLLYLGYSQAADWRRRVSPNLVESMYVWTTVAYIVWPAGARILLSRLPVDGPVDNWMAQACADDQIKAYCITPKIIRQAEAWNVGSDIAHSDEKYWGPDSDIRHSDDFYWGTEPGASTQAASSQSATPTSAASAPAAMECDSLPKGAMSFDFGSSDYWDIGSLE